MTNEEKQALIEHCKLRIRVLQNYLHIEAEKSDSKVYEIALAALTAQPVKLPKKEQALIGRDYLYVYIAGPVESAIRAAGYEVQE